MTRNMSSSAMVVAVLGLVVSAVLAEMLVQGLPPETARKLTELKEIHVATERRDGSRSSPAPVWFGIMENAVWFTTSPTSHKARRIRRGSPLWMSVDGPEGPWVKMKPEIILDGDRAHRLGKIYKRKYWIAWLGFFRPSRARNESGKTILLRLTPM